jgi:hypothetical protein
MLIFCTVPSSNGLNSTVGDVCFSVRVVEGLAAVLELACSFAFFSSTHSPRVSFRPRISMGKYRLEAQSAVVRNFQQHKVFNNNNKGVSAG